MSAIVDLQAAVTRFPTYGAFPVDGQMSAALGSAVLTVLGYLVTQGSGTSSATALGLIPAISNADGSANLTQITTSASGLATFLNQGADSLGLPSAPLSIASVTGLTVAQAGMYGVGAVVLIAAISLIVARRKKKKAR